MVFLEVATLIAGLALLAYSSEKTVECASNLARILGVPAIVIGVVLVSFGTDLPEIANSVYSSYLGHGDINVGDSLGSCLTQISLVLGLVVVLSGPVIAGRRNIIVLGGGAILAVAIAAAVIMDGHLSRTDAIMLILAYIALIIAAYKFTEKRYKTTEEMVYCPGKNNAAKTGLLLFLAVTGVGIGAITVVENVMKLSEEMNIPEYFISFFAIGLGTSLPELAVELSAARKKKYDLLLGDLMGSNITDATLALGIGPLLFPNAISGTLIIPLAIYVIAASLIIVGIFAWREKIDRKTALALVAIYLLAFLFTQVR